jgi:hypothetical protein
MRDLFNKKSFAPTTVLAKFHLRSRFNKKGKYNSKAISLGFRIHEVLIGPTTITERPE